MYDKIAKSFKRRKHLCLLLSLLGLGLFFVPLRAVTVPLGVGLCFGIYFFTSLLFVARPINKILLYEMDAEKFLYLSYELGYGGSVCDIYADYYRGRYAEAVDTVNKSLPKVKKALFRYEYCMQLAYCYFEMGDMDGLTRTLEELGLIPCESKGMAELKRESEFLLEFFEKFIKGEYEACKEMKIAESCPEDIRSVPAFMARLRLYHGIACHMNGDTEDAEMIFNEVATDCPNINFSKIARSYLTGEDEGKENSDDCFATIGDIKRQNSKALQESKNKSVKFKTAVIAIASVLLISLGIAVSLELFGLGNACDMGRRPADPYTVIDSNEDITRVVDILPVNTEGDALCIYLADGQYMSGITHEGYYSQILGIAYLDRVGDELYRYGVSVKFQQAEKRVDSSLYRISAPDLNKDVYFKIVSSKDGIPSDALLNKEFYVGDKVYYLCFMYMKDSEAEEYSFEVVMENNNI